MLRERLQGNNEKTSKIRDELCIEVQLHGNIDGDGSRRSAMEVESDVEGDMRLLCHTHDLMHKARAPAVWAVSKRSNRQPIRNGKELGSRSAGRGSRAREVKIFCFGAKGNEKILISLASTIAVGLQLVRAQAVSESLFQRAVLVASELEIAIIIGHTRTTSLRD